MYVLVILTIHFCWGILIALSQLHTKYWEGYFTSMLCRLERGGGEKITRPPFAVNNKCFLSYPSHG